VPAAQEGLSECLPTYRVSLHHGCEPAGACASAGHHKAACKQGSAASDQARLGRLNLPCCNLELLEKAGLSSTPPPLACRLACRNAKWTRFKLRVMMSYNAKLRAALVAEVEARTTMELQLVQQEVMHAQVCGRGGRV